MLSSKTVEYQDVKLFFIMLSSKTVEYQDVKLFFIMVSSKTVEYQYVLSYSLLWCPVKQWNISMF